MPRMKWIKLWTEEWLDGSIREYLTAEERSVWADLLALAGRSRAPGLIQAGEDCPYSHSFLAARLRVPLELLESTIQKCICQNRISENSNGILILNWSKYQSEYQRQKRYRDEGKQKPTEQSDAEETNPAFGQICQIYEDNIGMLTPIMGQELESIANRYSAEWFSDAVKVACESNVRKLSYIRAILERWQTEGKNSLPPKEKQHAKTGRRPRPGSPNYKYEDPD